jgi:hypothetical protein
MGGGVIALLVMWAGASTRRFFEVDRMPIIGFGVVVTTALLALLRRPLPGEVLIGLGLLAALPFFAPSRPDQRWRVLATLPGAAVLAFRAPAGEGGLEILAFFAIPIAGGLIAHFDAAHRDPSLAALGVASATGAAFLSLPDTQNIAPMAGVALVVAAGVWLSPRLALGVSVYPWIGLLTWITMADGSARPASAVGTIGALALVIIEPIVRTARHRSEGLLASPAGMSPTVWALGFSGATVIVAVAASRLAGTRASTVIALAIVAGIWVMTAGALAFLRTPAQP